MIAEDCDLIFKSTPAEIDQKSNAPVISNFSYVSVPNEDGVQNVSSHKSISVHNRFLLNPHSFDTDKNIRTHIKKPSHFIRLEKLNYTVLLTSQPVRHSINGLALTS